MKAKKIFASLFITLMVLCTFASCSSKNSADGESAAPGDAYKSESASGEGTGENAAQVDSTVSKAGLITAAAWNDNENFEAWKKLFEQNEDGGAKFFSYTSRNSWGLSSYNRVKVTVKNGENIVAGAKVTAASTDGEILFSAVSDASGVAYLFAEGGGNIKVVSGEHSQEYTFESFPAEIEIILSGSEEKKNIIDLMFVVDVTGSMGDELNYLKNEIADVVNRVSANDQNTVINLALLFYRDEVDQEELKYYDFKNVTTPEGLSEMQSAINSQKASGGGDTPEFVDEALTLAMEQQWSSGATTKIIFHILDAPPHSSEKDKERYKKAVNDAAEKGIRICPVLCSGADELTEYLTRQAAIYTGGTFIFVTDDSGIGNSHHDPNLPNATVELLNSLMVRLIKGYHTGTFGEPVYWKDEVKQ